MHIDILVGSVVDSFVIGLYSCIVSVFVVDDVDVVLVLAVVVYLLGLLLFDHSILLSMVWRVFF